MGIAILFAPVVYPWYLLYLTPFLLIRTTLPLIVWGCAVLITYAVWEIARLGGRWVVPTPLLAAEYGAAIVGTVALLWWNWRRRGATPTSSPPPAELS
jgi:hypothetical protein